MERKYIPLTLLRCTSWPCKAYPACTEGDCRRWWTVLGSATALAVRNWRGWQQGGQCFLFLDAKIELEEQRLLSQALPWWCRAVLMVSNMEMWKGAWEAKHKPFQSHQSSINECPTSNACLHMFSPNKALGDNWPTWRLSFSRIHPAPSVIPPSEDQLWRTYGCKLFFF